MWKTCTGSFLLLLLLSVNSQKPIFPDLADPRIVILGMSGAGKSSLANALLGCDPRGHDCMFTVCSGTDSCTKETSYGMGPWLGSGQNFTVVDTPGFGDSDGQDEELIEEMMDVLANIIEHSDTMLLVMKGTETRFGEGLQTMLKRMTLMFGHSWWDYLVVGVSFWPYDQSSIDDRKCEPDYPDFCHDESWYAGEINQQLNEKFGVDRNFTFVFTDSFSQTGSHIDDQQEQDHWQEEAGILWDITTSRPDEFSFMTINDFMEENARQKAEIKWLNDVITNNITELIARMDVSEEEISNNMVHIDEQFLSMQDTIAGVGSIVAWLPAGSDQGSDQTVDPLPIPHGWQRCDGSAITDTRSPLKGQFTPNINGEEYFIRGGKDDQAATTQEDMIKNHGHEVTDGGHLHTDAGHSHTASQLAHKHTATQENHNHAASSAAHSHTASQTEHHHTVTQEKHHHTATQTEHHHTATQKAHGHTANQTAHDHNIDTPHGYGGSSKSDAKSDASDFCYEGQGSSCGTSREGNDEETPDIKVNEETPTITVEDATPAITVEDASSGTITVVAAAPAITVVATTPAITVNDASSGTITVESVTPAISVTTDQASIQSSTTGIKVVSSGGTETRPRNIVAVYIMRIF